ncbi:MAG: hypothetical protein ACJA0H_001576 [Francisellaceae bacterium]|jgi:hypothetical protein
MARANNNFWNRYKFKINGLVLILSCYFLYQSLFPKFPDSLETKKIGAFEVSAMPFNLGPPYLHDGVYTKDFFLTFSKGQIKDIRQAYLNLGKRPLPLSELQKGSEGILHGSQHGQEVHAIAPKLLEPEHKIWLTIEDWQGKQVVTSWNLSKELL